MLIFVFNHGTSPARGTVSIRLPTPARDATDLASGQSIRLTRHESGSGFDVQLDPSAVQVVRVASR